MFFFLPGIVSYLFFKNQLKYNLKRQPSLIPAPKFVQKALWTFSYTVTIHLLKARKLFISVSLNQCWHLHQHLIQM